MKNRIIFSKSTKNFYKSNLGFIFLICLNFCVPFYLQASEITTEDLEKKIEEDLDTFKYLHEQWVVFKNLTITAPKSMEILYPIEKKRDFFSKVIQNQRDLKWDFKQSMFCKSYKDIPLLSMQLFAFPQEEEATFQLYQASTQNYATVKLLISELEGYTLNGVISLLLNKSSHLCAKMSFELNAKTVPSLQLRIDPSATQYDLLHRAFKMGLFYSVTKRNVQVRMEPILKNLDIITFENKLMSGIKLTKYINSLYKNLHKFKNTILTKSNEFLDDYCFNEEPMLHMIICNSEDINTHDAIDFLYTEDSINGQNNSNKVFIEKVIQDIINTTLMPQIKSLSDDDLCTFNRILEIKATRYWAILKTFRSENPIPIKIRPTTQRLIIQEKSTIDTQSLSTRSHLSKPIEEQKPILKKEGVKSKAMSDGRPRTQKNNSQQNNINSNAIKVNNNNKMNQKTPSSGLKMQKQKVNSLVVAVQKEPTGPDTLNLQKNNLEDKGQPAVSQVKVDLFKAKQTVKQEDTFLKAAEQNAARLKEEQRAKQKEIDRIKVEEKAKRKEEDRLQREEQKAERLGNVLKVKNEAKRLKKELRAKQDESARIIDYQKAKKSEEAMQAEEAKAAQLKAEEIEMQKEAARLRREKNRGKSPLFLKVEETVEHLRVVKNEKRRAEQEKAAQLKAEREKAILKPASRVFIPGQKGTLGHLISTDTQTVDSKSMISNYNEISKKVLELEAQKRNSHIQTGSSQQKLIQYIPKTRATSSIVLSNIVSSWKIMILDDSHGSYFCSKSSGNISFVHTIEKGEKMSSKISANPVKNRFNELIKSHPHQVYPFHFEGDEPIDFIHADLIIVANNIFGYVMHNSPEYCLTSYYDLNPIFYHSENAPVFKVTEPKPSFTWNHPLQHHDLEPVNPPSLTKPSFPVMVQPLSVCTDIPKTSHSLVNYVKIQSLLGQVMFSIYYHNGVRHNVPIHSPTRDLAVTNQAPILAFYNDFLNHERPINMDKIPVKFTTNKPDEIDFMNIYVINTRTFSEIGYVDVPYTMGYSLDPITG